MRPSHLLPLILLTSLGLAAFSGCAGKPVDETDPAALYEEANQEIASDHYQVAVEKLRAIKNKFPYSKYATEAQLRIADVYFLQESYGEAAIAYESFRDLHPKHEKVPYAMFRVAKSYYSDNPGHIGRDQTPAAKALDAYGDFLRQFPAAPEAVEAQKDVKDIRNLLAQKELYVANFYYHDGDHLAAQGRYNKILELFGDTESAAIAKERLASLEKDDRKKDDAKKDDAKK